jgi:hypothetical protein
MIRFLKEIYLTGFTLGFRFRIGPGWVTNMATNMNIGKGVVCVAAIEGLIFSGIAFWIDTFSGTGFMLSLSKPVVIVFALALYYANYYVLVTRSYGIKFEREFNNLKKSRKILLVASSVGLMVAVIAFSLHAASAHRLFIQDLKTQGR